MSNFVFHSLDHKSQTILCTTNNEKPYEILFLALNNGAPPVMSFFIIAEKWLHKDDHYQKHFREMIGNILPLKALKSEYVVPG